MKKKIAIAMFMLALAGSALAIKWTCKDCTVHSDGTLTCKTCESI